MIIGTITARKDKIGLEDIERGKGHVTQKRSNKVLGNLHRLNYPIHCGLLVDITETMNALDDTPYTLVFAGFYEAGDEGAGIYVRVDGDDSLEEDIGLVIKSDYATYIRKVEGTYVKPEWFGAKGDGVTNDFEPMLKALQYSYVLLGNKNYYLYSDNQVTVEAGQAFEIEGSNTTITIETLKYTNDSILNFKTEDQGIYFVIQGVTFKSKSLARAFTIEGDYITRRLRYKTFYEPDTLGLEDTELIYLEGEQTIEGEWSLENGEIDLGNSTPWLANHPVPRRLLTILQSDPNDELDYVISDREQTITGLKDLRQRPLVTADVLNADGTIKAGVDVNKTPINLGVVKSLKLSNYKFTDFRTKPMFGTTYSNKEYTLEDLINTFVNARATELAKPVSAVPPVGYVYFQIAEPEVFGSNYAGLFNAAHEPAIIWPGTTWQQRLTNVLYSDKQVFPAFRIEGQYNLGGTTKILYAGSTGYIQESELNQDIAITGTILPNSNYNINKYQTVRLLANSNSRSPYASPRTGYILSKPRPSLAVHHILYGPDASKALNMPTFFNVPSPCPGYIPPNNITNTSTLNDASSTYIPFSQFYVPSILCKVWVRTA